MCFSNSLSKALKSKAEAGRSIKWNCLGLLGFLSTPHPGSSTNLYCRICWQVFIFSIFRSLAFYSAPEFPGSQSLTCLHPNLIIVTLHCPFLPGKAPSPVSSPSSLPCADCLNDLERKMCNNTRRMGNEVRKMYNEIKDKSNTNSSWIRKDLTKLGESFPNGSVKRDPLYKRKSE